MPQVDPEFLFDFGSPNAYLAHLVLPGIERRTGARFVYRPVLLGGIFRLTGNVSPAESLRDVKNKPAFMQLETARFLRRHGITDYRMNPHFPVNTLQLMRGAVAAQLEDVFMPYVEAVFRAMWAEPRKMDEPEVFRAALVDAGLDAGTLLRRSQEQEVKDRLLQATQDAVARGVFGAPSFFVGQELFFGKDQLRDVEDEILAAGRS